MMRLEPTGCCTRLAWAAADSALDAGGDADDGADLADEAFLDADSAFVPRGTVVDGPGGAAALVWDRLVKDRILALPASIAGAAEFVAAWRKPQTAAAQAEVARLLDWYPQLRQAVDAIYHGYASQQSSAAANSLPGVIAGTTAVGTSGVGAAFDSASEAAQSAHDHSGGDQTEQSDRVQLALDEQHQAHLEHLQADGRWRAAVGFAAARQGDASAARAAETAKQRLLAAQARRGHAEAALANALDEREALDARADDAMTVEAAAERVQPAEWQWSSRQRRRAHSAPPQRARAGGGARGSRQRRTAGGTIRT